MEKRVLGVGLGAMVVILVWAGAWLFNRAPSPTVVTVAQPAPAEAPVVATPPVEDSDSDMAGDTVQLRVSGVIGAQVFVDGFEQGKVPLELSLPSKKGTRTVSVRRVGYLPFNATIAGDNSVVLTARLRPLVGRPKLFTGSH